MTQLLTLDDFPEFFGEVHAQLGHHGPGGKLLSPFTWQTRLAASVWERDGRWPDVIDIPTGAGKTAVLLVATFLLALDAGRPPAERTMSRRIAMVVDRRIVVDQAYVEAVALRDVLTRERDGGTVLGAVANELRSLWEGPDAASPIRVEMLRGGIVRDESWARRPDRPAILVSTVDQVGSRLLFRGYGVSPSMRPIHAGLLGNDMLLFLDEVHLSQPFAQTLRRLRRKYLHWGTEVKDLHLRNRWHVSELSATPRREEPDPSTDPVDRFSLDTVEDDLSPETAPVLYRRLHASKIADLKLVKVPKTDKAKADKAFARECADQVLRRVDPPRTGTLAAVVNRVSTARLVYERIATAGRHDVDVVLMTGRMRETDRKSLQDQLEPRLRTGRERDPNATTSLVVVATQCIEAGADFDFDELVTECASLDALRQRMGRLDRDGTLLEFRRRLTGRDSSDPGGGDLAEDEPARALILARSTDAESDLDDPVYGTALGATWKWLQEASSHRTLDFGWAAWRQHGPDPDALRLLAAPTLRAPVLLPRHLDLWVQTSPASVVDPEVAMWLHGMRRRDVDVQIVWRDDITRGLLEVACGDPKPDSPEVSTAPPDTAVASAGSAGKAMDRDSARSCLRDLLAFRPPASSEILSVPVWAAVAWLKGPSEAVQEADGETADVDGVGAIDTPTSPGRMRPVAIWRGSDTVAVGHATDIRPGMTLVVPADYGGIRRAEFAGQPYEWWDPRSETPATDVGDVAQRDQRNVAVLRLKAELSTAPSTEAMPTPEALDGDDRSAKQWTWDWIEGVDLGAVEDEGVHAAIEGIRRVARAKGGGRSLRVVELRDDAKLPSWFGVSCRLPLRSEEDEQDRLLTLDFEPENSSFMGGDADVELEGHLLGVEEWAQRLAEHCGLPSSLVNDLALAGRLHDLGKADPRFQAMLRNETQYIEGEPLLAKSRIGASDRAVRIEARRRSGYPSGARHELLSLALIAREPSIEEQAGDWDLVCHLVASHHGYCRPFAPHTPDERPEMVKVASGTWTLVASSDHGLWRIDAGVADRFWRLVRRYGWYRLAWFEAILRLADHRRSELEQEQQERRPREGGDR